MADLKVLYEDAPGGVALVRIAGEGPDSALDIEAAPAVRGELRQIIDGGRLVLVVDLSTIDSIDSAGLGVLVGALKRVHFKGGGVAMVAGEAVRETLSKAGLHRVFRIDAEAESAVQWMAGQFTEEGIERRRTDIAERARIRKERERERELGREGEGEREREGTASTGFVPAGPVAAAHGHSYEHLSEDITLVTIATDLIDVYTAPLVREVLVDVINQGRYFLVVDFTAVDSVDSTGLGVLVGGLKRVRAHQGALAVVVPSDRARKTFRITGLSKVFPIFDTVDRAVEFLGRELPTAPERMSRNGAV